MRWQFDVVKMALYLVNDEGEKPRTVVTEWLNMSYNACGRYWAERIQSPRITDLDLKHPPWPPRDAFSRFLEELGKIILGATDRHWESLRFRSTQGLRKNSRVSCYA
jgi:hypothetical protein